MFVAKKEPPFRTAHLHRACAARKTAWIGSFVHAGMITSFMLRLPSLLDSPLTLSWITSSLAPAALEGHGAQLPESHIATQFLVNNTVQPPESVIHRL